MTLVSMIHITFMKNISKCAREFCLGIQILCIIFLFHFMFYQLQFVMYLFNLNTTGGWHGLGEAGQGSVLSGLV